MQRPLTSKIVNEIPWAGVHQSQMQYGPVKFASPTEDGVDTRG
jgi:hypothetical protein